MITIRRETPQDYETVEEITREAFYNLYIPGCVEHYLVHNIRQHPDFLPELDFVLELDGRIAGYIMYTKATLTDEAGHRKNILTFGPLCIAPDCQRRGLGKLLMQHSFEKAAAMGYDTIVIFGMPYNYVSSGFVSCKRYHVCVQGDLFPAAMLVKVLRPGALDGRKWYYTGSPAMEILPEQAAAYDDSLPPKERRHTPTQEEFYIISHSFLT